MKENKREINLAGCLGARYNGQIMSTSFAFSSLLALPEVAAYESSAITCHEAFRGCIPSFVFSISGQTQFRSALDHLLTCPKRDCAILRKKVKDGMRQKLEWLFNEDALLGCVHVQPFLYGSRRVVNIHEQRHFMPLAEHLSLCPHESCAKLRRSILLKVRDFVSPAAVKEKSATVTVGAH